MKTETLVVVNVDTVGSEALRNRLGEHEYRLRLGEHNASILRLVASHAGEEMRDEGDGKVLRFPSASAALDCMNAIVRTAVARHSETEIAIRVGIAAGDADVPEGRPPDGHVFVEAARLQEAAEPFEILCSRDIRSLSRLRGHQLEPADHLRLASTEADSEPRLVYRLTRPELGLGDHIDLPRPFRTQTPFPWVGRETDWRRLDGLWHATGGALPSLLLLGVAGGGKSRLCREFAHHVRARGATVLYGRCDEHVGSAYGPFTELIGQILDAVPPEFVPGHIETTRLEPILAHGTETPRSQGTDPDTLREAMADTVTDLVEAIASTSPVLLILDDVTWIDAASVGLLLAVRKRSPEGVRLLLTARPGELTDDARALIGALRESPQHEEWTLSPFSRDNVGALADAHSRSDGVDSRLVDWISDRSAGNPLFAGEWIRHLADEGLLHSVNFQPASLAAAATLAPRVEGVVLQRVEKMSANTQSFLRTAAVLGIRFRPSDAAALLGVDDYAVVDCLAEAEAAGMVGQATPDDPLYTFEHAIFRDAIYNDIPAYRRHIEHRRAGEHIEAMAASDPAYGERMLRERSGVLAQHFSQSDRRDDLIKSVRYLRMNAADEERRLAHDRAVGQLSRALAIVTERIPGMAGSLDEIEIVIDLGIAERRAGSSDGRSRLLDQVFRIHDLANATEIPVEQAGSLAAKAALHAGRGVFSKAGRIDERMVRAMRSALELEQADLTLPGEQHADGVEYTSADFRRLRNVALLKANLATELTFADDIAETTRLGEEALSLARWLEDAAGDNRTLISIIGQRLVSTWRPDTVEERLELSAELRKRFLDGGATPVHVLNALTGYAQAAMEAGDFTLTDELLTEISAIADKLNQPTVVGFATLRLANRACTRGQLDDARRLADKAYLMCDAAGQPDAFEFYVGQRFNIALHDGRYADLMSDLNSVVRANPYIQAFLAARAVAAARTGDLTLARADVRAIRDQLDTLRFDLNWLSCLALTSAANLAVRDEELARRINDMIAPYADQFVDNASTHFGSVWLFLGLNASVLGETDAAVDHLASALAAHRRCESPPLIAATLVELARNLLTRNGAGDKERALDLLTEAEQISDAGKFRTLHRAAGKLLHDTQEETS